MTTTITADQILALLAERHKEDVFVPECKDGPSQTASHLRMDAWVMPRSWSKPKVTAYEIKISRSDFLKDDKWSGYLRCCNELYFACSWGLIQPQEIPDGVGLLWATKTGTMFRTMRKAAYREVQIPESLFRYILMSRAEIREPRMGGHGVSDRDYWANWLKRRELDREFGRRVGRAIREVVAKEVDTVKRENQQLTRLHDQLEGVRRFVRSIGLDPDQEYSVSEMVVRRRIEELNNAIPSSLFRDIDRLVWQLQMVGRELQELKDSAAGPRGARGD